MKQILETELQVPVSKMQLKGWKSGDVSDSVSCVCLSQNGTTKCNPISVACRFSHRFHPFFFLATLAIFGLAAFNIKMLVKCIHSQLISYKGV